MGAWSYGIFDDDTAYDFFDEIRENPLEFFKNSFEKAERADYLAFDDCHAITVSAAYLDNLLYGTKYRNDNQERYDISNVNLFGTLQSDLAGKHLKESAIKALQKVISSQSELNELWKDNKELYPNWKKTIQEIIDRLLAEN